MKELNNDLKENKQIAYPIHFYPIYIACLTNQTMCEFLSIDECSAHWLIW